MDSQTQRLLKDLAPVVLGALLRRFRDLQACEDAVQEALIAASAQWPKTGLPLEPRAWLIHVANRRITDTVRSETQRRLRESIVVSMIPAEEQLALAADDELAVERDDSLELLFHCCQPSLSNASAVALTLRAVGGLTTAEIARAFLVPEATMAQRLSRARQTVKDAGLVSSELSANERRERLPAVMRVIYLIFSEGYAATSGDEVTRADLSSEAIRLGRMLRRAMPAEPEVMGLLALMLLTDARRDARTGAHGALIPLDEQDRSKWNRPQIDEGATLIESAFSQGAVGPYQLQAAIASLHDEAASTEETDWPQIVALYSVLMKLDASPMVALNHAIAVAMSDGADAGLALIASLEKQLGDHYRLIAARGHLQQRRGDVLEAMKSFRRAAQLTASMPERDFLLLRAALLAERLLLVKPV
ncbi:MAG: sigma-70 family RNA polymerase sigma factor [Archangium sp.]